ncbi:MAG: hypothetical protein JWR09_2076 [Mucilaginibacter sp.]|nr:hypothetical protein [Mucilaginibacter sp.]
MDENQLTGPENIIGYQKFKRRRSMLPWWVIGFIWLFLVFIALMPVGIVFGFLKIPFETSLLGLTTSDPISLTGIFLIFLFSFKGITAFGLWTEKTWAIDIAKIDALVSIVICCSVMIYPLIAAGHSFNIRLELIALIPYYIKMNKIEYDWKNFDTLEAVPFPLEHE